MYRIEMHNEAGIMDKIDAKDEIDAVSKLVKLVKSCGTLHHDREAGPHFAREGSCIWDHCRPRFGGVEEVANERAVVRVGTGDIARCCCPPSRRAVAGRQTSRPHRF